jgi:hypothetical protein
MKNSKLSLRFGHAAILGVILLGMLLSCIWFLNFDIGGTYHNTVSLADLDNDGDLDAVVHNVRHESESTAFAVTTLWFNQGNGLFTAERIEESGWSSAAGDIDNDGDADLFVSNGHRLRIDLNMGGAQGGTIGEFGDSQYIDLQSAHMQFDSLQIGDLNNDGFIDGVVVGYYSLAFAEDDTSSFSWEWINESSPTGSRSPRSSILSALDGLSLRAADLGDLDGDGDIDLFAAVDASSLDRNTDPADRVLFNDGSGNFVDSGQRLGNTDSTSVDLGDVDNDGDLDALAGSENGALVWINQGGMQGGDEGAFALSTQVISGNQTTAVFLSDLDGDGDLDALIAGPRQAVIWWNDGQETFSRSGLYFRYSNRHGLAVGDFNNDGLPDIFAAAYSDSYKIWYNQGDGTFSQGPDH